MLGPGKILPDGEFIFEDLPPGKHRLDLTVDGPNGPKEIGVTEISLADENIGDVVLTPFTPALVRVRVVLEGAENKPLTAGSVFLSAVDEHGDPNRIQYQLEPRSGAYVLTGVSPGRYQIGFTNAGTTYLKSVQSGGRTLDPESIEVTDGASLDLILTYSKNVASVSGDVQVPPDRPKSAFHVLLIEQNATAALGKSSIAELDQFLHFSAENLAPGKYVAFAAEEDDLDVWNNANS